MRLKLVFRDDEQNHEFHRRVVERIELNAGAGPAERGHHLIETIGGTMWNGDAKADARAHGLLPLFQRSENTFTRIRLNFAELNEEIDQLDDGRPSLDCLHLRNDLI